MSNNCTARNDLLVALHTLASHFENALYAFGDDDEARKKAEGDIAWARLVASRHNYNGSECKEIERLRGEATQLRQAVGVLTTLHPTMEIDVNNPVQMAQEIVSYVTESKDAEIERLHQELVDVTSKPFAYCTEPRSEILARQQAEIERLREWNRQMVEKAADGGRLDGYRELAMKLAEKDDEIDQLRQECAALRDEVELKQAALTGTSRMMGEEIERLRGLLDGLKASHLGYQEFAESEFIKLRELLRLPQEIVQEVDPGPGTSCLALIPAGWWRRVREALGDE